MTTLTIDGRRGKYMAIYRLAARQQLEQRGELIGRGVFFGLLLLVFSSLWNAVHEMGALPGQSPSAFLWYLAVTEWIVLSIPLSHRVVEQDVQTGDIAYSLCRPVSYMGLRIAEAMGQLSVRMTTLLGVGFFITWALAGRLPPDPSGLILALPLGVVAGCVITLWMVGIGCFAFWLQDASAVHWVIQKLLFVLGGLILPLSIYPHWLRQIAEHLPFAAVLYGPARMAFGFDPGAFVESAVNLAVWGAATVFILGWLFARARARLEVNGG